MTEARDQRGFLGTRGGGRIVPALVAAALFPALAAAQGHAAVPDSRWTPELIAAVVGAIVGALIGWAASYATARQTEELARRREQKQADLLYRMLRSEIEYNREALRQDKEWINAKGTGYAPYQWAAMNPSPQWATTVWENSVPEAARAIREDELKQVHQFYASLKTLASTRAQMATTIASATPDPFTVILCTKAVQLMDETLALGNPLATRARRLPPTGILRAVRRFFRRYGLALDLAGDAAED